MAKKLAAGSRVLTVVRAAFTISRILNIGKKL